MGLQTVGQDWATFTLSKIQGISNAKFIQDLPKNRGWGNTFYLLNQHNMILKSDQVEQWGKQRNPKFIQIKRGKIKTVYICKW